jgi:hypothetical protein
MGRSLGKATYRPSAQAGGGPKMRGARPAFVLRRMSFARLLPASLLLAILTATIVTTALASFSIRALPKRCTGGLTARKTPRSRSAARSVRPGPAPIRP